MQIFYISPKKIQVALICIFLREIWSHLLTERMTTRSLMPFIYPSNARELK